MSLENGKAHGETAQASKHQLTPRESLFLLSVPGMRESIRKGMKTPVDECAGDLSKSLLIDTLAELFAGNEALFRGLAIHPHWDWSTRYPVIRISFAEGVLKSREGLDARIADLLRINREALAVAVHPDLDIAGAFGELTRKTHAHYSQRVVVLADEYDKPILDNLNDRDTARAMRDGLRNLYSVVKGSDAHIRFAFLSGVTKFSKVSIFSGLNKLKDITICAPVRRFQRPTCPCRSALRSHSASVA